MVADATAVVYPSRIGNVEVVILRQPESHHRARYQKEGSRGCLKDQSCNSCPAIQLRGYDGLSAIVQIFIATESGKIRTHPLYRVCKVGGKHCTPCRERQLDPVTYALEMDLTKEMNFVLNVDCLGIMKLRNRDFELSSDAQRLAKVVKRSPGVRVVFRVIYKTPDDRTETLQISSTPICCTPSPGLPEIQFISHPSCPASGGVNLVVIGRNFVKDDSKVFIAEQSEDGQQEDWKQEMTVLEENFHQVHLVVSVPPYRNPFIMKPVEDVCIYVLNKNGKRSEPFAFQYTPDPPISRPASEPSSPSPSSIGLRSISDATVTCSEISIPQSVYTAGGSNFAYLQPSLSSGSSLRNDSSLEYHIPVPGSQQSIIITLPPMNKPIPALPAVQYEPLSPAASGSAPRTVAPLGYSPIGQQNTDDPMLQSLANSPYMWNAESGGSGSLPAGPTPPARVVDDDLEIFEQLLKEVVGQDGMVDGLGYSTDYSGALTASSLRALNLFGPSSGNQNPSNK